MYALHTKISLLLKLTKISVFEYLERCYIKDSLVYSPRMWG